MYYQVVEEKCKEGIKSHYSKNERIDDVELSHLMDEKLGDKYEIKDEFNKRYYKFYDYDIFGRQIDLYFLDLIKIK